MGSKSNRNIANDKLNGAKGNIDWSQDKMAWIIEQYMEYHPEIGNAAIAVCEMLDLVKAAIDSIQEQIN